MLQLGNVLLMLCNGQIGRCEDINALGAVMKGMSK